MRINRLFIRAARKFAAAPLLLVFIAAVFIFPNALSAAAQSPFAKLTQDITSFGGWTPFTGTFQPTQNDEENGRDNQQFVVSSTLVISQVYGGGGNTGATYRNDYIEILNVSSVPQSLSGLSLQYGSASGNFGSASGNVFALPNVTLQPGQYFLFAGNSGGAVGATTPTPDATQTTFSMAGAAGKVVLLNGTTALNCGGPIACTAPQLAQFVDAVAYGAQTGTFTGEGGTSTPALNNTTAAFRAANGCTDTDNNAADFTVSPTNPRNTSSTLNACGGGGAVNLTVNDVSVSEGNAGTTVATFTVSLSQPAPKGGVTFNIATADGTATVADNDYVARSLTGQTIAAGNTTFTFAVTINGDATLEPNETFNVNVTNVVGATVIDSLGIGTINNDDANPTYTKINEIQGSGNASPIAVGTIVTTRGIVTARRNNGFFIQSQTSDVDADPNSSEGVFIFTSTAPPAAAATGNLVEVIGKIAEFVPSSDPNSPPLTELNNVTSVTQLSNGNALPAPAVLTVADTNPAGGLNVLEKYEGMRVRVESLRVVAPTDGNKNEINATSTSNGVFYGVINGINRPFREPGLEILNQLPTGAPANIPRFDLNPERIRINSFGQTGGTAIDVTTDATVANLVGVLDYGFRVYSILPDPSAPPIVSGNLSAVPVPAPLASQMTVASFNVERFFDDENDPLIGEPILTTVAFNNRLNKASLAIRNVLRTPDVVAIIEMENLMTLEALATKINNDAVIAGQPNPNYQASLVEGNDQGGIDVCFLVKSARITVVDVVQIGKTATYTNPNTGAQDLLNDRPPLVLRANAQLTDGSTFPFTVIVNHLRSLIGVGDESPDGTGTAGGRVRAKRRAQAEYLASFIQARQAANQDEKIIVVGDFNAFQFSDGYVDLIGTIKGTPAPSNEVVLASPDLVNPNLVNLIDALPNPSLVATNQAYSYVFDGNAQALDHILITQNLQSRLTGFHYARLDADFPEIYRTDPNRPERLSDHDPAVAYISLEIATATVSGRINNSIRRETINVIVTLTDVETGEVRYGRTGITGEYRISNVPIGRTFTVAPLDVRNVYQPASQTITVNGNLVNVNFNAL